MQKLFFLLLIISNLFAEDLSLCKKGWNETLLKKFDSAIILFAKCIKQGNLSKLSLAQTYRNIGITYNQSGKYQKAIESYNQALELNNNFIDYVNRGNAYSNLGKYMEALEDYKKAFKLNPKYSELFHNRGLVYFRLGLLEKASKDYLQAYKLGLHTKNFLNNITLLKKEESNQASVGFVMTLSNFIGRTAKNCIPHLNKNDKWMNNLVTHWTTRNRKYIVASKAYLINYFGALSSKNKDASEILQDKISKMVIKNSKLATNNFLSSYSDKVEACEEFEKSVIKGKYDITTKMKMYKELQELL